MVNSHRPKTLFVIRLWKHNWTSHSATPIKIALSSNLKKKKPTIYIWLHGSYTYSNHSSTLYGYKMNSRVPNKILYKKSEGLYT